MAQTVTHDCCTDDDSPYFEAETEGLCENHCELSSSRQDSTRLKITVENLLTSTHYAYFNLKSKTGLHRQHPEFVVCRPLYGEDTETVYFDLWHDSTINQTDELYVEIYTTTLWDDCNGTLQDKTEYKQPVNVDLEPEFEYV